MTLVNLDGGLQGATGAARDGVRYFCTLRAGGISRGACDSLNLAGHVADDPRAVEENRARLRQVLPEVPLWLEQVHGTQVHDATHPRSWRMAAPRADAAVTALRGMPLAILTADCLPVVLSDDAGMVLGVAHAGWRGLAAGVLEATVEALRRIRPQADGWQAWIGPAIGPAAFEVGEEVHRAFVDGDPQAKSCFERWPDTGRWHADLPALARLRLMRAGVADVELSGECTYRQHERYFSYRRDAHCGRQATIAWLA